MKFRSSIAGVAVGVLALALLLPARARADTCNGFVAIDYPNLTGPVHIGDTVDVRIFLAAGSIDGGTDITFKNFFFNLACDAEPVPPAAPISPFGLGSAADGSPLGCKDDPAHLADPTKPVQFVTGSLSGGCNVGGAPGGFGDGLLVGTPGLVLTKAIGPFPVTFCTANFKVQVTGLSGDSTPLKIEELVGYHAAACDNGLLDSGNFQTAAIDIAVEDNFDCYQVTGGLTPPPPLNVVSLVDRFTDTNPTLSFEHRVCTANTIIMAAAESADAAASGDHFTGYGIKKEGGNANADVTVTNSITGTLSGHVGKAVRLLVPATKALGKGIDPGPPTDTRHFQCYQFAPDVPVPDFTETLTDQFILASPKLPGQATLMFPKSLLLCPRVDKNGEDPGAPSDSDALLCFQRLKNIQGLAQNIKASTRDQFQNDQNLSVTEFQELCVASTIQ